jgi:hypothetical protein
LTGGFFLKIKKIKYAAKIVTVIPPTTPPTTAPIGRFEFDGNAPSVSYHNHVSMEMGSDNNNPIFASTIDILYRESFHSMYLFHIYILLSL